MIMKLKVLSLRQPKSTRVHLHLQRHTHTHMLLEHVEASLIKTVYSEAVTGLGMGWTWVID